MQQSHEPVERTGSRGLSRSLRLCLFVAVVALIYWFGTSLFSAARMEPVFYPLFRSLFHASAPIQLFDYLTIVRLTAHYMEYFVLFLLLVWLLGLRPMSALILCVLLAAADEGHQYFLPDRSCSLRDLNYDAAGAATAFVLTIAAKRLRAAAHPQTKALPEPTGRASA